MAELIDPIDINDPLFQAFVTYTLSYRSIQELWLMYLAESHPIRPVKPRKISKRESRALFKRLQNDQG